MKGQTAAMLHRLNQRMRRATTQVLVLLLGRSGLGKTWYGLRLTFSRMRQLFLSTFCSYAGTAYNFAQVLFLAYTHIIDSIITS